MTRFRDWIQLWVDLIRHPGEFFRAQRTTLDVAHAVTFGLVCHWLGQLGSYFVRPWNVWESWISTQSDVSLTFQSFGLPVEKWLQVWDWFVSPARVLLDPFFQILSLGWTALFIWIGTFWLLKGRHPRTTFSEVLGLLCLGQAPQAILAFAAIVPMASFLVGIYTMVVGVIGFKAYFGVTTRRAMGIYFFPALVAWSGVLAVVAVVTVLILPFLW